MTDTQTIADGTNSNVVVSVDAMGGDKGPGVIIAGLLRAVHTHSNIRFLVHGPQAVLAPLNFENIAQWYLTSAESLTIP